MRSCLRCGEMREETEFKSPTRNTCRLCVNEMARLRRLRDPEREALRRQEWLRKNPDAMSFYSLKYNHKLTKDQYEKRLAAQGNGCAVCRTDKPGRNNKLFCVDHDHDCCPSAQRSCGKCVRGLLCHRCNAAIGLARESVDILRSAVAYLEGATV